VSEFREEFRSSWPVLTVAFVMIFFGFGVPAFSLMFIYAGAVEEFGWTREQATLLASYKFVTAAAAGLLVGRLLDILQPKYVVAAAAVCGSVALGCLLFVDALPAYYAVGVMLGVNAGGMTVAMKVLVCRIYERSAGTALGLVLTGTSAAGVVLPLCVAPMMQTIGWRPAMAVMSLGTWLVGLPCWFGLFRLRPELAARLSAPRRSASVPTLGSGSWRHVQALARTRTFWMITGAIFLGSAVDQGLLQNQVLFLKNDRGLSLESVAWATSLLAGLGVVAKIAFGWLYDRWSIRGIVLCYALLCCSVLLTFTVVGTASMLLFVAIRGLAHGGLIVDVPVLTKHYYGPENLGLNLGLFTLVINLGYAVGPPVLAGFADRTGSYVMGFSVALVVAMVATLLLVPVRPRYFTPPRRKRACEPGSAAGTPARVRSQSPQ
jgi:MFS family permease